MNETLIAQWIVGVNVKPCKEYCTKCGSDDVYRRFIAKGEAVPYKGSGNYDSKFRVWERYNWRASRDHLHHYCRCCGFAWQGLPLKRHKVKPAA